VLVDDPFATILVAVDGVPILAPGSATARQMVMPVDEWAVASDGRVAIVRGQDYHVDWVAAVGQRGASPRISYPWRRLTDAEQVQVADSMTHQRDSIVATFLKRVPAGATLTYDRNGVPDGYSIPGPGATPRPVVVPPRVNISDVNIPDYLPAFETGALRADADNRLWTFTKPAAATAGGPVFDVIGASGARVDRVQLPEDRTIIGFGAKGVVYLVYHDGGRAYIEKRQSLSAGSSRR
jgi:hypothetical protein